MAFGPMFFNIIGDRPSGPMALELLDFLMASNVWAGVNVTLESLGLHFSFRRVPLRALTGFLSEEGVY